MNIKKISMLGFKSFMDRLEIGFPEGISGIVGPNGCGKSNIIDAIRWCLGEQSSKQLRGRKMEDVIFSGAGNYKPLGMAEVSLLFENGNGHFPSSFAKAPELSVTRRLYRSGESEYLINNIACRLKDIQEIFMDTGLGSKPYSIIGQGKISTILEQKPEETRIMIEEAAGITRYRRKVEESQKKIEMSEENLQRVEDILREVESQMRSLKRQAAKARRYKEVSEEIQKLELTLYANAYGQFEAELGKKQRSAEDLVQEEVIRSAGLSQVLMEIETMTLELEEKDRTLSAHRDAYHRLRERVHKKETGIESLAGEMTLQQELEARLQAEQEDLHQRLQSMKEEKLGIESRIEASLKRSTEMEASISLGEQRLRKRKEGLAGMKEDFERARSDLTTGLNKEMSLRHESGYIHKMLHQITDSHSRLEAELKEANTKMEHLVRVSERKNEARALTAYRIKEIEAGLEEQNLQGQALEEDREAVEAELKTADSELNGTESRLTTLRTMAENFEGYKIGVRSIMKSTDLSARQQGKVLGLLADVIQVDPAYEQALEAVLGERLQCILVDSWETGLEAVDYLKTRAKGRGSFAPIHGAKGHIRRGDGDLHLLWHHVSVPDAYADAIRTLLGQAVLVKDLHEAISQCKGVEESPEKRDLCFVTPEGDILEPSGLITGGKVAHGAGGLLAKKRELVELQERCETLKEKVRALTSKRDEVLRLIQERKKSVEMLREDKWTTQDEINDLDKQIFRIAQELDQIQGLGRRITADLERKDREQFKHKEDLQRIEKELNQRTERRRVEEVFLQGKEMELKEAEREFDQLRDELSASKADYGVLKEEYRSLLRERDRLNDYVKESSERIEKTKTEITLAQERSQECLLRQDELRGELKGLYDHLQESEEALKKADLDRQAFQSRIKEQEAQAYRLRADVDEIKERLNRARMEHSEIQFRMNNVAAMVKEKSNMDLSQVYGQYLVEDFSQSETEGRLQEQKDLKQGLGEVNLTAIKEHEVLKERFEFIKAQRDDLIQSIESLRAAIRKINKTSLERFRTVFAEVDQKLKEVFPILFNGGTASLKLLDEANPLESGVLVEMQPPGKKISHMGLLSGGEKALVAMALLFAIYMIKPSPFCLLDEVDAPLDEANVDRFNDLLLKIKESSQIIMVTHNRRSMEVADRLYGVTMEQAGLSKTVSVDLRDLGGRLLRGTAEGPRLTH